ncbi:hypothetical protein FIBSPDRAFT_144986 [Athelia psychrophila]|uniref:Uncharacterized protein n=1 Tax=Athelia psychrophila TaxID=1759441 RepID=A0A166T3C7_9AGAM|nr:hypothetical protein FIBSPDRAFT_144986 [Fibularhizoctonia sp. CBS 109695]
MRDAPTQGRRYCIHHSLASTFGLLRNRLDCLVPASHSLLNPTSCTSVRVRGGSIQSGTASLLLRLLQRDRHSKHNCHTKEPCDRTDHCPSHSLSQGTCRRPGIANVMRGAPTQGRRYCLHHGLASTNFWPPPQPSRLPRPSLPLLVKSNFVHVCPRPGRIDPIGHCFSASPSSKGSALEA